MAKPLSLSLDLMVDDNATEDTLKYWLTKAIAEAAANDGGCQIRRVDAIFQVYGSSTASSSSAALILKNDNTPGGNS